MNLGSYTETGAGDINLRVNSQSYDFLESRLGVKAAYPFRLDAGALVPEVHFNWFYELANPTVINNASFVFPGSLNFSTPGLKTANSTLNGGIGFTFLSCACTAKRWSVEAVYDRYWRSDNYSANQGMIKFSMRF
jgi:outer membrane autotransporter protein